MQVERVSGFKQVKTKKNQPFNMNCITQINPFNRDSASFGHGIIMTDTQQIIHGLIKGLLKFGRSITVKDITLGEISAAAGKKKGTILWDLVLSLSKGKGTNREINTYYYSANGGIAKEIRLGSHNRFIESGKLDETEKLEWNNSVQAIATILFKHLPQ